MTLLRKCWHRLCLRWRPFEAEEVFATGYKLGAIHQQEADTQQVLQLHAEVRFLQGLCEDLLTEARKR